MSYYKVKPYYTTGFRQTWAVQSPSRRDASQKYEQKGQFCSQEAAHETTEVPALSSAVKIARPEYQTLLRRASAGTDRSARPSKVLTGGGRQIVSSEALVENPARSFEAWREAVSKGRTHNGYREWAWAPQERQPA